MQVALLFLAAFSMAVSVYGQTAPPATGGAADSQNGEKIFQHSCSMCHSTEPNVRIVGPSLYGETKSPHAAPISHVQELIEQGKGMMPAFKEKLTAKEMADLLAYVQKL